MDGSTFLLLFWKGREGEVDFFFFIFFCGMRTKNDDQ